MSLNLVEKCLSWKLIISILVSNPKKIGKVNENYRINKFKKHREREKIEDIEKPNGKKRPRVSRRQESWEGRREKVFIYVYVSFVTQKEEWQNIEKGKEITECKTSIGDNIREKIKVDNVGKIFIGELRRKGEGNRLI